MYFLEVMLYYRLGYVKLSLVRLGSLAQYNNINVHTSNTRGKYDFRGQQYRMMFFFKLLSLL